MKKLKKVNDDIMNSFAVNFIMWIYKVKWTQGISCRHRIVSKVNIHWWILNTSKVFTWKSSVFLLTELSNGVRVSPSPGLPSSGHSSKDFDKNTQYFCLDLIITMSREKKIIYFSLFFLKRLNNYVQLTTIGFTLCTF